MTQAPSEGPSPLPALYVVAAFGVAITGLLFLSLGLFTQVLNIGFGLWFCEVFVFFAVPFVCLRIAGYDARRTAGAGRPWLSGAAFGLVVGAVNFFAFVVPAQYVSQRLAPKELVELFDISSIFKHQTPVELALVVLGVCLAAPICEEFCFRGLLQRGLSTRVGGFRAVLLTAAIFSGFHMDPIGFLARFELGVVFGVLALRSGSIWPGVFAHLGNNAISTGLYFATRDRPDADDDLKWWVPLAMAAAGLPVLALLWRLAGRWPAVLEPAERAAEHRLSVVPRNLVLQWAVAGALSVAALLLVDPNGVKLNLIDVVTPLREPKKEEGPAAHAQWEQLWRLRDEARAERDEPDSRAKLKVYESARKVMLEAHQAAKADGGTAAP